MIRFINFDDNKNIKKLILHEMKQADFVSTKP